MPNKKKKWLLLFVVFVLIFGVCAFIFVRSQVIKHKAEAQYKEVIEEVNDIKDTEAISEKQEQSEEDGTANMSLKDMLEVSEPDPLEGIEIPEKDINWDDLCSTNPDIYAWIYIPDTKVDYPILQHESDDSFYLNHNLDLSKGNPGCLYTEKTYNSKDFTDKNTVVYGHNMKDGSMFGTLHRFDDSEFAQSDKYIYVYHENEVLVYKVFGAYEFPSKHILWSYDFTNEYVFEDYIKEIYSLEENSKRYVCLRHDVDVNKDDKVITLSTCTLDSSNDYRYIVSGVLLGIKQVE
ncbi:MAG: class B sortase [Lachnospiraceae bacterium]|nr:class B sortase [Lachnospiraceae bacterium]